MAPNDKAGLRRAVRRLVQAMTAGERSTASAMLCERMRAQELWRKATGILCFAPLAEEPDITALIDEAWRAKPMVAFPRFESLLGQYAPRQVRGRNELVAGLFGVLEPAPGCPAIPLNQLDLVLVPGVAFDFAGRRLGRGKGFYDRLLAQVRGHKCGVAFDRQLVAELPEEPHDVRVDSILTPTQWLPARVD